MSFDGKAFGAEMTGIVKEAINRATEPLLKRIEQLEARPIAVDGKDGRDGIDGTHGKDGAGVVDVLRNHEGVLIFTLSDGRIKEVGNVNGKDGTDGKDGSDGKDGEAGKDGRDGFGFDDMEVSVLDDDRTIELAFRRGEEEKAFTLKWPTVIDRGVFKEGTDYQAGDGVTWGGSFWIAQNETKAKPDAAGSDWRLAVKKGRDGKDAK